MFSDRSKFIILMFVFLFPFEALAFTVSPLRLYMKAEDGRSVVRVGNPNDEPVTFQLEAFYWPDSKEFSDLEKTEDLLAVPPVFEIDPGEEQVIRIALRKPIKPKIEKTYRIILSQVPDEVGSKEGVSFSYRISMPLFVATESSGPEANWSLVSDEVDGPKLVLNNTGSAHIQIDSLALTTNKATSPIVTLQSGEYIFAGEEHSWQLDIPASELKGSLDLEAKTNRGLIESTVTPSRG